MEKLKQKRFTIYTVKDRDLTRASLVAQVVKNLPAMQETWVRSLGWENPLEKGLATHSSILPGESQGRGGLMGCCLWGRTESDTTEAT